MKDINLDASGWREPSDFYAALFAELGSPSWHGQNFNALRDGLSGGINQVEAPFRVNVLNAGSAAPEVTSFLQDAVTVFAGARDDFDVDVALVLS
jgi:RNAse (barnase) inhibitor barstar